VHVFIDNNLQGTQKEGAVRLGTHGHPVVSPLGRGVVFGRDDDHAGAALDTFQLPVRFRHLVLDEVLTPAGVQLGKTHVRKIDVGRLGSRPKGVRGILIAMPGVVRPITAALCLIRAHFTNPAIEQCVDAAVHPGVAHFAQNAQHRHARAMLKAAGARPLHHLDHFRRIPLLAQSAGAGFAAVAGRHDDVGLGGIGKGRIPGHTQHVVQKPCIEFVLGFGLRRELGGAVVHPGLPAFSHQWALQAIRPVHPAMEREPL
jgi:hypothetical protein